MEDLRKEIPRRAFINAQIIQSAVLQPQFRECVQKVFDDYGLPEMGPDYEFKGPAYVASLLYCLVVVPKEIWSLPENHQIYKSINVFRPVDLFAVHLKDQAFDTHPSYHLIQRLRNSIAHANFTVNSDMEFEFRDRKARGQPDNFRATISIGNLALFLSKIGAKLANIHNLGCGA